ncbi:hypothetical protein B0H14DRAFT_174366 [Mycena olivaceomarginata]|nr:hypothetical protein B0H14DRAFT_174366 [Mycena olivaceomarginata]
MGPRPRARAPRRRRARGACVRGSVRRGAGTVVWGCRLRVGASSAFESAFESSADPSAFEGRDGEGDAGHHNARKEEEGEERGRRRREGKERALRMPHLAARVEGVVCAGWPPWEGEVGMEQIHLSTLRSLTVFPPEDTSSRPSSAAPRTPTTPSPTSLAPRTSTAPRTDPTPALLAFLRAHPTIERLAIVGGEDSGFGDDDIPSGDVPHSQKQSDPQPFLPRLTHLHAPPALAVRLLEHIAAAPFCAPAPIPSRSSPSSSTTPPTKQSSSKPGLSAASLALLAPDPKRMTDVASVNLGPTGAPPRPRSRRCLTCLSPPPLLPSHPRNRIAFRASRRLSRTPRRRTWCWGRRSSSAGWGASVRAARAVYSPGASGSCSCYN